MLRTRHLADPVSQGTDPAADDDSTDDGSPGSPTWEAADAQTATDAAMALMTAAELIRTFAQREQTEVAVGKGNDIFDSYAATEALCGVSQALGIMSQLAFHEGLEAAKSLPEDETIEKAGRRLAGKTVAALAAARDKAKDLADHIGGVLGVDDPANKDDSANKSIDVDMDELSKEIENMTTDELTKVLDAREEKLVGILAEALKPPAPEDKKVKKAKPVAAEADDDEVTDEAEKAEADEESDEVAEPAEKAAEPVELTPEVTEANEAAAAAKKESQATEEGCRGSRQDCGVDQEHRRASREGC